MDDASRIETFKQWLRIKFQAAADSPDIKGLREYVAKLGDGAAGDEVAITEHEFEGASARGQLVLEPLAKLNAALAVLAEIDPDNTPPAPSRVRYADFGGMTSET